MLNPWWRVASKSVFVGGGCIVSIVLLCFVAALCMGSPAFREVIPKLVRRKLVLDFCLVLLWCGHTWSASEEVCTHSIIPFFTECFLLGSELFFFAFCVNVLHSLENPFLNANRDITIVTFLVVSIAFSVSMGLISNEDYYGEAFFPVCWTNTKAAGGTATSGASLLNLGFFYLPLAVFYFFSIVTVVYATAVLSSPMAGFDRRARIAALRELQLFVFFHGVYWGVVLLCYAPFVIVFESPDVDEGDIPSLNILYNICIFLLGARSLEILPVFYYYFKAPPQQVNPKLSKTLQRDVMHYVVEGICCLLHENATEQPERSVVIKNPYRIEESSREPLLSIGESESELPLLMPTERSKQDLRYSIAAITPWVCCLLSSIAISVLFNYHITAMIVYAVLLLVLLAVLLAVYVSAKDSAGSRISAVITEYQAAKVQKLRDPVELSKSLKDSLSDPKSKTAFKISKGRSGAFLFVTSDDKYIVKTIEANEQQFLVDEIFSDLIDYWMVEPESSLVRIYGVFSLLCFGRKFHLIVMENIMPRNIDICYDLKGSWVDRSAKLPRAGTVCYCKHCSRPFLIGDERSACRLNRVHEPRYVLKDNDFNGVKVLLPLEFVHEYKNQIHRDVAWLAKHDIMDYSLLLGVRMMLLRPFSNHVVEQDAFTKLRSGLGLPSFLLKGHSYYHIGIIDYLQKYDWRKRAEFFLKKFILRKDDHDQNSFHGLSSVDPVQYALRFNARVVDHLIVELRDFVQVCRQSDFAPIAIVDMCALTLFEEFLEHIVAASPSATSLFYIHDTQNIVLDANTFREFVKRCHETELMVVYTT